MTIKLKLLWALCAIALIGMGSFLTVWISAQRQSTAAAERLELQTRAADAGRLSLLAREIEISVLRIQEQLTDYGATRGQNGLTGGLEGADVAAQDLRRQLNSAANLAAKFGGRDANPVPAESAEIFERYYALGIQMAKAYANEGTAAGNQMMPQFDQAAEQLAEKVAKIEDFARTNAERIYEESEAGTLHARQAAVTNVIVVLSMFLMSLLVIIGAGVVIYVDVLRPLSRITAAMTRLAEEDSAVVIPERGRSDEIGQMAHALTIFKDNLGAKRAAAQFRDMLNALPFGVFMTRISGEIIVANQGAQSLLRAGEQDLSGMRMGSVIPLVAGAQVLKDVQAALEGNEAPVQVRRIDGSECPCEVHVASFDSNGIAGALWSLRDVTRRVETERARADLQEQLRRAQKMESLGTMAGGIAHELNTPIQFVTDNVKFMMTASANLVALIEILATDRDPAELERLDHEFDLAYAREELPQAAAQALDGLSRLSEIVLAVKRFSHPGRKAQEFTDVNDLVKTTLTISRNNWKYVAVVDLALDETSPRILANEGEIGQALLNLIVNAAHAIEDRKFEGKKGVIHIATKSVGRGVEVRITDNGVGMTPEVREKIFDLFFTTKGPERGSGQGLSLAHSIVTLGHKGQLTCESTPGTGTTFVMWLPETGAAD